MTYPEQFLSLLATSHFWIVWKTLYDDRVARGELFLFLFSISTAGPCYLFSPLLLLGTSFLFLPFLYQIIYILIILTYIISSVGKGKAAKRHSYVPNWTHLWSRHHITMSHNNCFIYLLKWPTFYFRNKLM